MEFVSGPENHVSQTTNKKEEIRELGDRGSSVD